MRPLMRPNILFSLDVTARKNLETQYSSESESKLPENIVTEREFPFNSFDKSLLPNNTTDPDNTQREIRHTRPYDSRTSSRIYSTQANNMAEARFPQDHTPVNIPQGAVDIEIENMRQSIRQMGQTITEADNTSPREMPREDYRNRERDNNEFDETYGLINRDIRNRRSIALHYVPLKETRTMIPEFDGTSRHKLQEFWNACTYAIRNINPPMQDFETRDIQMFEELKHQLETYYQTRQNITHLQIEFNSLKQKLNETAHAFGVGLIAMKLYDSMIEGEEHPAHSKPLINFQIGLCDKLKVLVRAQRYTTLQEVITGASAEEKLLGQNPITCIRIISNLTGHKIYTVGKMYGTIRINNQKVKHAFYVILGIDFLRQHSVTCDYKYNRLKIGNAMLNLHPFNKIILKPRSETIIKARTDQNRIGIVCAEEKAPGVYIGNCIVNAADYTCPNAPLLVVPKKADASGKPKLRVVINFRKLNDLTIGNSFPLPNITDILDQLGNAKYFTTQDLASGYHQIPMTEKDKNKTAFSTPYGHYEFNRMPFELKNAPATFQRLMNSMLIGMQGLKCLIYLDDIVIYIEVLQRLRENNLKLQSDKCEFLRKEVIYLGHIISENGISPDPSKLIAIKEFPTPKKVKDVQSFIGLAGYYRKFMEDFSKIAKPLTKLTKKIEKFEWTTEQQNAFEILKEKLMTAPVLRFPDFNQEFIVITDASDYAIGVVLSQGKGR
ncbi:hypothetical protein ACFW04_011267 [Cataglyphis niger]